MAHQTRNEWSICWWLRRLGPAMLGGGIVFSLAEEFVKEKPEAGLLYLYILITVTGILLTAIGMCCRRIWRWWVTRRVP